MKNLVSSKLAALLVFGLSTYAYGQMTVTQYQQADNAFKQLFYIDDQGAVKKMDGAKIPSGITTEINKSGSLNVFSKTSDGTTKWFVGNQPCTQNKEFNCLSVYNSEKGKSKGGLMAPEDRNGDYTLYRMNQKNPEQSTVISCSGMKLTLNSFLSNDAKLSDCQEYSKESCSELANIIDSDPVLIADIAKNGEHCTDLVKNTEKLSAKLRNSFQKNIKGLSKELANNFDSMSSASVDVVKQDVSPTSSSKFNSTASVTNQVYSRMKGCDQYLNVFDGSTSSKAKMARYREMLSNVNDSASAAPTTKRTPTSTSGTKK